MKTYTLILISALVAIMPQLGFSDDWMILGEQKTWHKIDFFFEGPESSETAIPNPFLDYRLDVAFKQGDRSITVPGYFAADGVSSESGADSGTMWRVHFMPDSVGKWTFNVSFKRGKDIAILNPADSKIGKPGKLDGLKGEFNVTATDKTGRDFRGKGALQYVGKRYLQFAETQDYYIKGGTDSPENFLAYYEFDGTTYGGAVTKNPSGEADPNKKLHRYDPHAKDWKQGDRVWHQSKGKNIIGALNYLASKGMNSVYFLTMNVIGDGKDVWPWTRYDERYRFDCSKLDQWGIVFDHMTENGLLLHVITQETENDQLLDGGDLGSQRKLYYREMIARFAHHPALVWNLGEENTNSDLQRKSFSNYIRSIDPYNHPIVVHTYPGQYDKVYSPLVGFKSLEGPSLQMGDQKKTHTETIKWIDRSTESGREWIVCLDEIGPADTGVKPDKDDPTHDDVRYHSLWGNLMAGGAGCEWYMGYKFAHNDLNCEDWRSRDTMWDQTRYALKFFQTYLPFPEMTHNDALTPDTKDYCFAKPGEIYAIYNPGQSETKLTLEDGNYMIKWFNPRNGGKLLDGSKVSVSGPGLKSLGSPPTDSNKDWVVLVTKK